MASVMVKRACGVWCLELGDIDLTWREDCIACLIMLAGVSTLWSPHQVG